MKIVLKGFFNTKQSKTKLRVYFGGFQWDKNGNHVTETTDIPLLAMPFIKLEYLPYFFVNIQENGTASDKDLMFFDSKEENWKVIKAAVYFFLSFQTNVADISLKDRK